MRGIEVNLLLSITFSELQGRQAVPVTTMPEFIVTVGWAGTVYVDWPQRVDSVYSEVPQCTLPFFYEDDVGW